MMKIFEADFYKIYNLRLNVQMCSAFMFCYSIDILMGDKSQTVTDRSTVSAISKRSLSRTLLSAIWSLILSGWAEIGSAFSTCSDVSCIVSSIPSNLSENYTTTGSVPLTWITYSLHSALTSKPVQSSAINKSVHMFNYLINIIVLSVIMCLQHSVTY